MRIYLSSPYSDPDPSVRESRFEAACRAAAKLMLSGNVVFSPIAHSHPISRYLDNALDLDFWLSQDRELLEWCDKMDILRIPGWQKSTGIEREMQWAMDLWKPVGFIDP